MTSPVPLPPREIDPGTRIERLKRLGSQPVVWAGLALVAIAAWFLAIVAVSIEI